MKLATPARPITSDDRRIGNEILSQIGFLIRGCLDMAGERCVIINNGVRAQRVIVDNQNNRGSINIVLNGWDLYDLTITRNIDGEVVTIKEYTGLDGLDVAGLRQVLDMLWQ